jgi:lipopolysaccharide export system protein LptC
VTDSVLDRQRPKRHWTAQPRQDQVGAPSARRSRRVALLKYLLIGVSLALVATIIIWPQFTERRNGLPIDFADVDVSSQSSTMTNARFVSGGERSVNVTADKVVQDPEVPTMVHLSALEGDTTTDGGVWMHMSARSGVFDRAADRLELTGDVSLYTDQGNEIHSPKATIDMGRGEVRGDDRVAGHGPYGHFRADSFEIREEGNVLLLRGNVQLVVEPSGEKN